MNEIMCLLETLEIDFDFEQFSNNLFNFKVNCDLKDLCKIKFENSPFKAKMQTFYTAKKLGINVDAPSSSSDISSCDSSIYDLSACVVESRKRAPSTKARSVQQSNQHPPIKTREVTISEISDPKTFYVQDFQFIAQSNPLIRKCNQCAMEKKMPTAVVIDEMYLVYENNRDEWHRGIVTEKKKLITLYLVDYGRHVQVMLKQIREISDELKQIPKSSSVFTIRNVEPTEGKWSEESNELILQMALGNNATIIYTEENSGDCIIHLDFPTSIEETLLYLNYAQARKIYDEAEHQITNEMMREKKLLMERLNNTKPFVKHVIKDESYCKVTNIVSPAQLYITSEDHIDEIEVLHGKLQQFYAKPYAQKLYYPHLQMVCCVCIDDTTWYRARIEAHHPGCVVEVYLVDIGKYMNIGWRFLRRLDDQFSKLPEGVTECSLVDIAPKNHAKDWGLNVTTELKRLCKDKLKVNIIGFNSRTTKIQLYIVKKKINYQINAYLAKHHLVEWVGDGDCIVERVNDTDTELLNESAVSAAISKEASQRKFRQTIKIVDIVSPSEFYVTLVKYESAIKKMHTEIQNTMKSYVPVTNNSLQWKVGDCCLVTKCLKESNDWYRGKIESNMDNQNFIVFLRDHGEMVFAKLSDLAPISPSLGLVIDGTMKCHLANIKPTSTDWAKAAIDEFKYITREECDIFAISVYGEVNNASTPVYLWGRKKQVRDDAIGAPINWININEAFASLGYADSPARFKTIVDCNPMIEFLHKEQIDFNAWHEKLLNLGNEDKVSSDAKQDHILRDGDDFILEAELDPDNAGFLKEIVTTWLPAQPISKYYFNACPTYVDNNAVIYLHEQSRSNYLKQIMYTINRTIGKDKYDESYKWKENEPCMVKYHLDDCFYRGLIKEVLSNGRYKVVFVDYGNIELCEAKELRVANVLGNVPIQATKYYLAYVKSISDDGIWGQKILEFIHVTIVNKSVSIRVEDNIDYEYVPCTITIGAMDLIKTLVAEKLAEYTPELPLKRNLPETHDFYHENSRLAVPDVRDVDSYKESIVALDLFKEKRAKRTEAAKVKEFISKIDIDQSADFIVEESDVELQPNNTFQSDSIEYEADFKPLDTSTTISTAMKTFSLLPFKPIQLTKEVIKFPCKIYEVLDTLHLFVEPIIQEYNDNFDKMEKKIKTYCNKKRNHSDITASRYCLAPYKEDNFYYRAVVNERISKTQARIRFVDYLNEEVVDCKSLRECPAELLEKPLKHMIVKLHGITPSRRIRDSDIKRQLHSLTGQTAIAFVVVNGDIPAVRLYDQNHSDVLLYKSLIDLKFFIETR